MNLTGPLPDLSSNLQIEGLGADQLTVRRNTGAGYRIFTVTSGSVVSISGITISGGNVLGGSGGGINNGGTLTISGSTISGNSAGFGGGIYNDFGTLTISGSTISDNSAGSGGGVYSATDLSGTTTTITNSTISANTASGRGAGVRNIVGLSIIENSTITKNTVPTGEGSGVASAGNADTRTEVLSTIVAANTDTDVDLAPDLGTNSFDSKGYNLIGDGNAITAFDQTGDQSGVGDPKLGALANNGGPTQTHALLAGSPAIDKGNTDLATDQRGAPRPFDDPSIPPAQGSDDSDIGSFEAQSVLNTAPDANNDAYEVDEDNTLTVAASGGVLSNDTDSDGDTLTAVPVSGPSHAASFTLNADGSFTYEPDDNYNGPDSFSYLATDGTEDSDTATVSITVNPVNDAPVATDGTRTMNEDGAPITIDLASLASDGETSDADLTYDIVSGPTPAQGTLSSTGSTRTFDSAENFNGTVEIIYTVSDRGDPDGCGTPDDDCDAPETSDQGTVTINVTPVNDAPTLAVSGGSCLSDTSASGRLNLTVGDVDKDDPPSSLLVSAASRQQDQGLIPDANLVAGGSGADRTLNAVPRKSGTAIITVTVDDGTATSTLPVTLRVGTQASETITGAAGTDVIFGLGGSGVLEGGGGPDLICGGNGSDTLRGGGGNDVLDGGRGNDILNGGNGNDMLLGKAGDDRLTGGTGSDFFSGGSGTDVATDFNVPPGQGDTKDNTTP